MNALFLDHFFTPEEIFSIKSAARFLEKKMDACFRVGDMEGSGLFFTLVMTLYGMLTSAQYKSYHVKL